MLCENMSAFSLIYQRGAWERAIAWPLLLLFIHWVRHALLIAADLDCLGRELSGRFVEGGRNWLFVDLYPRYEHQVVRRLFFGGFRLFFVEIGIGKLEWDCYVFMAFYFVSMHICIADVSWNARRWWGMGMTRRGCAASFCSYVQRADYGDVHTFIRSFPLLLRTEYFNTDARACGACARLL